MGAFMQILTPKKAAAISVSIDGFVIYLKAIMIILKLSKNKPKNNLTNTTELRIFSPAKRITDNILFLRQPLSLQYHITTLGGDR